MAMYIGQDNRKMIVFWFMILACLYQEISSFRFHSEPLKIIHPSAMISSRPKSIYMHSKLSMNAMVDVDTSISFPKQLTRPLQVLWDFSRPHTVIGSVLSIVCLYLFVVPKQLWPSIIFLRSLGEVLVPSLLTNLYITGLNQLTDIDIDKINKPYLPLASGALSPRLGSLVVLSSLVLAALWTARLPVAVAWPLQLTVFGSMLLGTIYSLPPFRLKRYPLLAAFCILVVRGSLVNLGFFLQAKQLLQPALGPLLPSLRTLGPYTESLYVTVFFAIYGLVIALLKDVPDVAGDEQHAIATFSVTLGPRRIFRWASRLLSGLLGGYGLLTAWLGYRGRGIGIGGGIATLRHAIPASHLLPSLILAGLAWQVQHRANQVDEGMSRESRSQGQGQEVAEKDSSSNSVFSFYMFIWNVFYACYLLLPLHALLR